MSHSISHEFRGVTVPNGLLRALVLALATAVTGAAVFALTHGSVTVPDTVSKSSALTAPRFDDATIPVLPTVVVRAQVDHTPLAARINLATTVLPTVSVHAERTVDTTLASLEDDEEPAALVAMHDELKSLISGSSGGFSHDMPYYSFGKTLRRLNKE